LPLAYQDASVLDLYGVILFRLCQLRPGKRVVWILGGWLVEHRWFR
jgi:hypothetical protein